MPNLAFVVCLSDLLEWMFPPCHCVFWHFLQLVFMKSAWRHTKSNLNILVTFLLFLTLFCLLTDFFVTFIQARRLLVAGALLLICRLKSTLVSFLWAVCLEHVGFEEIITQGNSEPEVATQTQQFLHLSVVVVTIDLRSQPCFLIIHQHLVDSAFISEAESAFSILEYWQWKWGNMNESAEDLVAVVWWPLSLWPVFLDQHLREIVSTDAGSPQTWSPRRWSQLSLNCLIIHQLWDRAALDLSNMKH